jgi:hypothetical protein
VLGAAVVVALALAAIPAQAQDEKETYTAFAMTLSGGGGATQAEWVIERWSTEEERAELLNILIEQDQEALVKALQKKKRLGFFQLPSVRTRFPSTALYYAHKDVADGKQNILLVTDRPIGFAEALYQGRSMDYDISIISYEMPVEQAEEGKKKKEKGKGQLLVGVKLGFNKEKKQLTVERYAQDPVRLTNIELHEKHKKEKTTDR